MELEITPEPTPEERVVIEAALTELADEKRRSRGAWWEASLAAAEQDDGAYDVADPRSSRGAARA